MGGPRSRGELPPTCPRPRLLTSFDTGDWVALVFEDIEGRPPAMPWRDEELRRVLDAVGKLSARLTPRPSRAPTFSREVQGNLHRMAAAAGRRTDRPRPVGAASPGRAGRAGVGLGEAAEGDTLVQRRPQGPTTSCSPRTRCTS
ncbi:hypothetical protein [Nonomuraea dietziae]|uniref:hypothetical protein n=1 Tax=Nonomuraea dietziae TaxID=65515 RepID=UPI0031D4A8AF